MPPYVIFISESSIVILIFKRLTFKTKWPLLQSLFNLWSCKYKTESCIFRQVCKYECLFHNVQIIKWGSITSILKAHKEMDLSYFIFGGLITTINKI